MLKMEFLNPTFKDGSNLTCRLGTKWCHKLAPLMRIKLVETGKNNGPEALITAYWPTKFSEIDEAILKDEHDPDCRTFNGLAEVMRNTYPEFTLDSVVTLVRFEIDESLQG